MDSLYSLKTRQVGNTLFLSVVSTRGGISVESNEKVLPPILEYDALGNFTIIQPKDVIQGLHCHGWKPLSKEFNAQRLADVDVAGLFKQLEHFPTLPQILEEGKLIKHPVAELVYGSMVYLKPQPKLSAYLEKIGYLKRSKALPKILARLATNFEKLKGKKLDLFSVPKRRVGTFCYVADDDGYAKAAKLFSFGFWKAIPSDRIARELSSLKACERFINPQPIPASLPEAIKPYVSTLRVAIVGTKVSMLDSADLFPSGVPKIACKLGRATVIKDVATVPMEQRNLVYRPFRAGIEVVHQVDSVVDETVDKPATIRFILPGDVKVASQLQESQGYDSKGKPVDMLMDFRTFASKGAIAVFAMADKANFTKGLNLEQCIEIFKNLPKETVIVEGEEYEGYIIDIPVMRPGQRYTELSKSSSQITVDLIAKAILRKRYIVRPTIEKEFAELKKFRQALIREIKTTPNE